MIGSAVISRSPMRRSLLLALTLLTALASCTSKPESGSKRGTADSPSAPANEEATKGRPSYEITMWRGVSCHPTTM